MVNQPIDKRIAELLEKATPLPWPNESECFSSPNQYDDVLQMMAVNAFPVAIALAQAVIEMCDATCVKRALNGDCGLKRCRLARDLMRKIEEDLDGK